MRNLRLSRNNKDLLNASAVALIIGLLTAWFVLSYKNKIEKEREILKEEQFRLQKEVENKSPAERDLETTRNIRILSEEDYASYEYKELRKKILREYNEKMRRRKSR